MDFNRLNVESTTYPKSELIFSCPESWNLMKDLAYKLSEDFPHVRVDFYNIDGKVYFGELTFYTHGGMFPFNQQNWDYTLVTG